MSAGSQAPYPHMAAAAVAAASPAAACMLEALRTNVRAEPPNHNSHPQPTSTMYLFGSACVRSRATYSSSQGVMAVE